MSVNFNNAMFLEEADQFLQSGHFLRIKTYLRSTQGQDLLSALATISIESELLNEIRQKSEFYDNIIQEYCYKERRMDFTFF